MVLYLVKLINLMLGCQVILAVQIHHVMLYRELFKLCFETVIAPRVKG